MRRLVVVLLVAFSGIARADEDAVQHYRRGQEAFQAGRYQEAIEAFDRGYQLDPRPEFLLNLAQCHRALGNHERAVVYLERFIEAAPAGHRLRPAAEKTLAELKKSAPPPEPAEPPRPPPASPPRVVADPSPPPIAPVAPARDRDRRSSSHVWVWVAAAAAVVAVATTVLLVSSRDRGEDVDDTLRLPRP